MLKKKWTTPTMIVQQISFDKLGDVSQLSNAELKTRMEDAGYKFKNNRKVYHSNQNYILREIVGESVLVSIGEGVADFRGIVKLNASAKVIWTALQKGATKEELVEAVADAFSISKEKAEEDVDKSLELLKQREMVICE